MNKSLKSHHTNGNKSIVLVVTSKQSASAFLTGFAQFCMVNGHDVTIIADGINPSKFPGDKGSVKQIPVKMERNPSPFKDLVSLCKLTKVLRTLQPDILVYGTPKASLLSSVAGFVNRIPVRIYQLWGLRLETTDGLKRSILELLEKVTSNLSTKVLANSQSLSDRYRELNLHSAKDIDLLGLGSSHGVDLEKYSKNAEVGLTDAATLKFMDSQLNGVVFGFVGRLHEDKGIATLLEAMRLVVKEVPNARLVLVGGDEGASFSLNSDLENCVHLAGETSDPRPYYKLMDALILPSLREGFPNVVLEAAAMEVPSIVSDGTGVIDSVIDGSTGIIAPVGDAKQFSQAMMRIARDQKFRDKLGKSARAHVEQNFAQELVWARTLEYILE
ncbi:glycosyltransferase family 4 protein [Corynebacterium glutamicum]|uniref:glycosyltransferase family 4 protein n=1 Tax=Corynebacterium glutamicum TaxID=1718 RepID=UPI003B63B4FC